MAESEKGDAGRAVIRIAAIILVAVVFVVLYRFTAGFFQALILAATAGAAIRLFWPLQIDVDALTKSDE